MTLSRFDVDWVEAELQVRSGFGLPIHYLEVTTSTNDEARQAAGAGATHGTCFVAEAQSAGRGRRGRSWEATAGEALLFSVVLARPELPDPSPLTLAIGLALHRAVQTHVTPKLSIKWPNDLVCSDRKLAGILVETELGRGPAHPVVAGVGVNVNSERFLGGLAGTATSVRLLGGRVRRETLLVDALLQLRAWYELLCAGGAGAVVSALRDVDALFGRPVCVEGLVGTAVGFDAAGHLLVRDEAGRVHTVTAGTVTVR